MSEDFLDFIRLVSCLFLFLLINKEFHVISFTNGYTDELVIKTKKKTSESWLVLFATGHQEISLWWKTLERITVMRRA